MVSQDALLDDIPYVDNRFTVHPDAEGNHRISCGVCPQSIRYGMGFEDVDYAKDTFRRYHMSQHAPGRVPDVRHLTVTYTGTCSACASPLECELFGGDRLWCDKCGATWDQYGTQGRTYRKEDWPGDVYPPEDLQDEDDDYPSY